MNVFAALIGFIVGFAITLVLTSFSKAYSRGTPDRILDFKHNSDPFVFYCNVSMSSIVGGIIATLFYFIYPLVFLVGALVAVIALMGLGVKYLLNKFNLK